MVIELRYSTFWGHNLQKERNFGFTKESKRAVRKESHHKYIVRSFMLIAGKESTFGDMKSAERVLEKK